MWLWLVDLVFGRRDAPAPETARADTSPPPIPARDIRRRVEGLSVRVSLEYCDQTGVTSRRLVDIEALEYAYGTLRRLDGYCRKRRAERSFLVSGILSLTDLETGEAVEDLEAWAADCAAHAGDAT